MVKHNYQLTNTERRIHMTAETTIKRRTSLRTNALKVGSVYDFEIYNNGDDKAVLRAPATVLEVPSCPIRDMGKDDAMIIQVEGETEVRRLVRNNNRPFYLETRSTPTRMSRVRFHTEISSKQDSEEEATA